MTVINLILGMTFLANGIHISSIFLNVLGIGMFIGGIIGILTSNENNYGF